MGLLARLSPKFRYAIIAALAFSLGNATVVVAGPVVSGFVGLIDGSNTAAINPNGELSVTDAAVRDHLANVDLKTGQLAFDSAGNLKTTSQGTLVVGGTVGISDSANTVKIDPANNGRTAMVTSEFQTPLAKDTLLTRTLDVSAYQKIRVLLLNSDSGSSTPCGAQPVVVMNIAHLVNGHRTTFLQFFEDIPFCSQFDKTYEVPGNTIFIQILMKFDAPAGATTKFNFEVYGR